MDTPVYKKASTHRKFWLRLCIFHLGHNDVFECKNARQYEEIKWPEYFFWSLKCKAVYECL